MDGVLPSCFFNLGCVEELLYFKRFTPSRIDHFLFFTRFAERKIYFSQVHKLLTQSRYLHSELKLLLYEENLPKKVETSEGLNICKMAARASFHLFIANFLGNDQLLRKFPAVNPAKFVCIRVF